MGKLSVTALGLLLTLLAGPALAGIINVPGDYLEIFDAVDHAAAGDTVLVDVGTFSDCTHETAGPESNLACVIMKSGVTLIGAGPNATIIDADSLGVGIFVESVNNVRIENLQVTGAFAEVYGAGIMVSQVDNTVEITEVNIHNNDDGGIICVNATPIITNVNFTDNLSKQGGGLSLEENSPATVVDCFFDNNEAPFAAGLFVRQSNATISGCTFQNNATHAGGSGGAIEITDCSADIIDCLIVNNTATGGSGGGLFYENCPGGTLIDCVIMGNAASPASQFGAGGGIKLSSSGIEITNVLIVDNNTGPNGFGGGAYVEFGPAPVFTNVTFANNSCAGGPSANGGGLYCDWFSAPVVDKCIIAFSTVGEGIYCNLANGGSAAVSCTDVYGNAGGDVLCGTDLGGNFSLDPLFCGTVGFEYNLQTGSPCIPGNHPGGPSECGGNLIGAMPEGCSANPVDNTPEFATQLLGNAPNPFNPRTTIFFVLAEPGPANLRVFDLRGRLITSFHWSELPPGRNQVEWNGKDLAGHDMPSGVYLYQLEAHNIVQTQRMSLIR